MKTAVQIQAEIARLRASDAPPHLSSDEHKLRTEGQVEILEWALSGDDNQDAL